MRPFLRCTPLALMLFAACGGSNPNQPPPPPTTTTTLVPEASNKCGTLAPGPVTRFAITPREQREDGVQVDMRVRARPGFDEVWCVDKDKEHRLDFNSNQRNADGKECCWINDPEWFVSDPDRVVDSAAPIPNTNSFNYRLRINTHGARATVDVQARIDGIDSFPWQSGSGYRRGPLQIVSMSQNEINRDCKCIFKGNGIYEGEGCSK